MTIAMIQKSVITRLTLRWGKDILHRTSMLQSIESYSHIDAVIRLKTELLNT